jgi:hypothetical protein
LSFIDIHTNYIVNYNIHKLILHHITRIGEIETIQENKKKSTSNEPRLNATSSYSLDLGLDELLIHFFDQLLISCIKQSKNSIKPSGFATWQVS